MVGVQSCKSNLWGKRVETNKRGFWIGTNLNESDLMISSVFAKKLISYL